MRHFRLEDGSSSKFWDVAIDGVDVVVRFGRIGTKGQERRTTFATADEAASARDKLVREKTGKGYVESTADAKQADAKPAKTKAAPKKKAASASSAVTWPANPTPVDAVRFFEEADRVLFERGFPRTHIVTDEAVKPSSAMDAARAELDAIDPRFGFRVPLDVARRFVVAYLERRIWGHGPKGEIVEVPAHKAAREAALAGDRVIDASTFEAFLSTRCPAGKEWRVELEGDSVAGTDNETYAWRLAEMVYIHEAALGTEHVAKALASHLVRALNDLDSWGHWGRDPYRHNATAHHLALTLGTLRQRMEPEMWTTVVAPFRGVASERLLVFADLLACLADDARTAVSPLYGLELARMRRDVAAMRALVVGKESLFWYASEATHLLGGDAWVGAKLGNLRRLPDWKQVRFVEEVGRIAIPEVAVAIAILASTRSGRRAASVWLLAHAEFARPILVEASTSLPDEADRARMTDALAILGTGSPLEARVLSESELERELNDLFGALEANLARCKGNAKKELAVMRATFERYCEARAAAGDVIPESHFGHELIDWQPKDAASRDRWIELAAAVQVES